ncbi:MAG: DUF1501 domain-containing protein [Nitrospiraceae bacterium]
MQRRTLLKVCALAPTVIFAPSWVRAACAGNASTLAQPTATTAGTSRILVLVELHGGNDGLNTLIPFDDSRYYTLRPRLAIPREQVRRLTPTLGFHPALDPLMPFWEKELGVVAGVGYPQPNRSHFRSIEIWDTGSGSTEYRDDGWLAQLFREHPHPASFVADAVLLGKGGSGPLAGQGASTISLRDPDEFLHEASLVRHTSTRTRNPALQHILSVQQEIGHAAGDLQQRLEASPSLGMTFPDSKLGKQLETAARLLAARTPVAVIKVMHAGFDTHAGQLQAHHRLLEELAQALISFRNAMVAHRLWDEILVATYSEFGRRPAENGSAGTDHGTAAPHLLFGGRVKGGLYGTQPSLAVLQDGDLRHTVDYRSLYSTMIANWWELKSDLFDRRLYPPLDCIRARNT